MTAFNFSYLLGDPIYRYTGGQSFNIWTQGHTHAQSITADMVNVPLRCLEHLPFLCTPSLRLSLATEDCLAHIRDRWKGGLTLPESIPPGINVEIQWINSLAPSLFAWGHSEGCALHCPPEVPRGIGTLLSPVETRLIVFFLFSAIHVSFHHFPSSVSWGHLRNKVLALGSVFQCLLLGELNQSQ